VNESYVTSRQLKERYGGVSDMTLWRWLRDESLNFPKPLVINGRRLWRLPALEAWEANKLRNHLHKGHTTLQGSSSDQIATDGSGEGNKPSSRVCNTTDRTF
jgi:predicted DNA-binding transcriptional regulator AlpA